MKWRNAQFFGSTAIASGELKSEHQLKSRIPLPRRDSNPCFQVAFRCTILLNSPKHANTYSDRYTKLPYAFISCLQII